MSINSCYQDISRYNTLKNNLYSIVNSLNSSSGKIEPIPNLINNIYSINDSNSSISSRCRALSRDIKGTSNFISSTVIPAIDEAIREKHREIAAIEAEQRRQAEERRRQEEERRRREEEARNK